MDGESPGLTETFSTLLAFERLLFGVDIPVVSEMILPPEGLVADVARVRPLVCVRALVDQQIVRLGKMAAAELAHKLLLGFGRQPPSARLPLG